MQTLEVIEGGRVKRKVPLNDGNKRSITTRFRSHGAKLPTLAWETGHTTHRLCEVIAELSFEDGFAAGREYEREERARARNIRPLPIAA